MTAPLQATGEAGLKTTYTYDALGRLKTVTSPRGNVSGADPSDYTSSTTYDDSVGTVTVTDPLGDETVTASDHAGNRLSVQSGDGTTISSATEWAYDDGGRLIGVCPVLETDCEHTTDPKTHYEYCPTTSSRPSARAGITATFRYDADGNLKEIDHGNGDRTPFSSPPVMRVLVGFRCSSGERTRLGFGS